MMHSNVPELIAYLQKAYDDAKKAQPGFGPFDLIWKFWPDGSLTISRVWPNGYKFVIAEIWPEDEDEE